MSKVLVLLTGIIFSQHQIAAKSEIMIINCVALMSSTLSKEARCGQNLSYTAIQDIFQSISSLTTG